jgi:hypothetical protein
MFALPALELGKVGLADRSFSLGLDRTYDLFLGHLSVKTAEMTFDEPQITQFFSRRHLLQSAISYITICNLRKRVRIRIQLGDQV